MRTWLPILLLSLLILGQSRLGLGPPPKQRIHVRQSCGLLEQYNRSTRTCELITGLAVESVTAEPGEIVDVVVHGAINGEETFGVTIMLEILPREGSIGDVWFTLSPPSDIEQVGDPWVDVGVFSSYDTDLAFSDYMNGTVDDDGNYIPAPVWYEGPLSLFPIEVSEDASGVWDISLSTSEGDSNWEGVETILRSGTVVIR